MIGFGTYRVAPDITADLVKCAILSGCTLIDSAQLYKNEAECWSVVREYPTVSYTTKIHRNLIINSNKDNRSIETSIVGVPNLVLLHSPDKNFEIAWEQLKRTGLPMGVSNFVQSDIEKLSTKPLVNQIEVTPFNEGKEIVSYCQSQSIVIQTHSSLTKGELLDTHELVHSAKQFGLSPAQAMIQWSINQGYIPIFSSKNHKHIEQIIRTKPTEVILPRLHIGYKTHPQYFV